MPRVTTVLIAIAMLICLVAAVVLWRMEDRRDASMELSSASVGGPFTLVDQGGRVRTDKDLRGHYVLLYFGYTYCPDVCPTTLALMQAALLKLGGQSGRVVPVFVTIDPARDTPTALKTYLSAFGSRFVGLTGTKTQIDTVTREFRVYVVKRPLPNGNYSMDHSSIIYLLDPQGHFVKTYDDQMSAAQLADDLKGQL